MVERSWLKKWPVMLNVKDVVVCCVGGDWLAGCLLPC